MIFDRETPMIIYGAGEIGSCLTERVREWGYNLCFILDYRKKGSDVIPGETVFRLGEEKTELNRNKYVVVICLADGMQHESVINNLCQLGYQYFIFLPMGMPISRKIKHKLVKQYNALISGNMSDINEVETYSNLLETEFSISDSIIREDDRLTVWMKDEVLFTESLEHWQGDKQKVHGDSKYQDINISAYVGYRNIFQYLKGKADSCNLYFDGSKVKKTKEQQKNEIIKREELNRVYETEYNFGMDFFIDAAPVVTWNKQGYWNLHGGHHRIVFLQQQGHTYFPVKMERSSFEYWCNQPILEETIDYIRKNNMTSTMVSIPHPAFYNFPAKREICGNTVMGSILRFLGKNEISEMKVLDCSPMDGYFARMFRRMQAQAVTFMSYDENEIHFAQLLNKLLYIEGVSFKMQKNCESRNEERYTSVISIAREKSIIADESIYEKLDALTQKYLFVETLAEDEILREKFLNNTTFTSYQKLHEEVYQGKRMETGVFIKEE